jgi:cell division septation protein DedD
MDKYLVEILKAFKTIIIPGLGALNLTNPETGECLFMPYLKYDDGKLSQYVSETEGMSDNDAKNLIAKYVREIEAKLNNGESYDMYQFGSFIKNTSGDIEFNCWNKETIEERPTIEKTVEKDIIQVEIISAKEVATIESVPEKTPIEIIPEKIKKPRLVKKKVQPIEELKIENKNAISENTVEELSENVEEPIALENNALTEHTIEPEIIETATYSEADQWADDLDVPPLHAKIERPKKPIIEKTKKDKKRRKPVFYLLLVAGVLLVGGTLTFGLFYNSLEKFLPFMAKETTVQEKNNSSTNNSEIEKSAPKEDSKMTEEESLNEKKQVEPKKNVKPIVEQVNPEPAVTSSNSYHIIGGAFTEKSNADRYQNRLVSEGNQSIIIGQFDNLYIVSIASFSSIEAANNALTGARSISSKAWVFIWP